MKLNRSVFACGPVRSGTSVSIFISKNRLTTLDSVNSSPWIAFEAKAFDRIPKNQETA